MADSVRIEGLKDLEKRLRALPKELGSKGGGPLRYALFKASQTILLEARRRVPVNSGELSDNIVTKRDRNPKARGVTEAYSVGMRGGSRQVRDRKGSRGATKRVRTVGRVWYGRMVELGTSKVPARPFLRPAFESKKHEAVQEFEKHLLKALERAERKLSRMR